MQGNFLSVCMLCLSSYLQVCSLTYWPAESVVTVVLVCRINVFSFLNLMNGGTCCLVQGGAGGPTSRGALSRPKIKTQK